MAAAETRKSPGSETPETQKRESRARPSIAILPLKNLTGDPGEDHLVEGLAEELAAELGLFRVLRVIINKYIWPKDLTDHLLEGLRLAGLEADTKAGG